MKDQTFEFRLRKIFAKCAVNRGLNIKPERYQVRAIDEGAGRYLAEGILLLATKEEEVFDYPLNTLTKLGRKWAAFRARMPLWLRRRFPQKWARVWAVSKFPDVNVPAQYFGSEFVHFRVIDEKELEAVDG